MHGLAILYGAIVGVALGLTGSGGGIFAVPLLVYGLHVTPREAVGVSLASVGGTALLGVLPRLRRHEVETRTGLLFALFGIAGAPVGTWLSRQVSEGVLLILFSGLMLLIAAQMWRKSNATKSARAVQGDSAVTTALGRKSDVEWSAGSFASLAGMGLVTGVLSGLFGIGGGFVIVPTLVLLSGMTVHRAVGTSLMVIFLVSLSGVGSYLLQGGYLSLPLTLWFILGGFLGVQLGSRVGRRMSGATLQRVFAIAIMLVAMFVVFKSTSVHRRSEDHGARRLNNTERGGSPRVFEGRGGTAVLTRLNSRCETSFF